MTKYYFNFDDNSFLLLDNNFGIIMKDSFSSRIFKLNESLIEVKTNWLDKLKFNERVVIDKKMNLKFFIKGFSSWVFDLNNKRYEFKYRKWHKYQLIYNNQLISTIEISDVRLMLSWTYKINVIDESYLNLIFTCIILFVTCENVEGGRQPI